MKDRQEQRRIVEGLLLAAPEPLTDQRLGELVPGANASTVRELVTELNAEYARQGRGFEISEVAGGWQLRTCADLSEYIHALRPRRAVRPSRAALETLAVVAYKQPITRAEIEHVRGVDAGAVLRSLLERDLVRIAGHREIPGRPMLYATTRRFLEVFGLSALEDLPSLRDLQEIASGAEAPAEAAGAPEELGPEEEGGGGGPSFDETGPADLGAADESAPDFRARLASPLDEIGEADDADLEEGGDEPEEPVGRPH
ncbi:MAG TPA: SMC-Scp complex subunit ScpB [Myxococcota bacterium]|nr:SMC-Scp complex subunit ScpB [Myxococcota bacterium]